MVRPIQRVIQSRVQAACDRNISLSKRIPRLARERHRRRCGARERDEFDHIPPIQGKIQDAGIFHHFTDTRIPGFHQSRVGLHLDRLRDLSHFQDDIKNRTAVDFQSYSALHIGAKPRQRRLQPIWSNGKVRQNVGAGFVGDGGTGNPSAGLSRGDFHSRQNCARRILNSATNLGGCLRPQFARVQRQDKHENHCRESHSLHHRYSPPAWFLRPPPV